MENSRLGNSAPNRMVGKSGIGEHGAEGLGKAGLEEAGPKFTGVKRGTQFCMESQPVLKLKAVDYVISDTFLL